MFFLGGGKNRKISVCVPFYNIESYVSRCLDSILNNTYRNIEVICVNDASTDNTLKILRKYEERDSRVIIIDKKTNEGLPSARNSALDRCTGDFIAIIDGDDWIHKQYFEALLNIQEKTKADVVCCDNKICSKYEADDKVELSSLQVECFGLEKLMDKWNIKSRIWGRIYSKETINQRRLPCDVTMGEDTLYNLSVLCSKNDVKIASIDAKLYYYFNRENSIVHTVSHGDIVALSFDFLENIEDFSEKGKKIILLQALNSMFAYRYLEMYNHNRNEIKCNCKKLYKLCTKNWNNAEGLSIRKKMEYRVLYYFPIIYRLMRIIKDPTMLNWEREQRKSIRRKKN